MPVPDRMLTVLRQALTLVRATPGRKGHVVALRDCTDVMVVGDLHGNVGQFQSVLKIADLANHPGRHLVLQEIIHGKFRYPTGGDKSHQLVDLFAALKCQYPKRVHCLPGNHELAQWTGRKVIKADEDLNALFEEGIASAYGGQFSRPITQAYTELFQLLPLVLRAPNRVLISHSLPSAHVMPLFEPSRLEREMFDSADLDPGGTVYSLLWGRDTSRRNVAEYLAKMDADLLVSGHIASEEGYSVPNDLQVIVDCSESPGGYALVPADRPITHQELVGCVRTI
jgi:hypothetical protein